MIEQRRGCGFRKAGGIYLRGSLEEAIPTDSLPACIRFPFSRGPSVVRKDELFETSSIRHLPMWGKLPDEMGLIWVGECHYSPAEFLTEALTQGISRRLPWLPTNAFAKGKPIAAAHISACPVVTWEGAPMSLHCDRCRYVPEAKAISSGLRHLVGGASESGEVAGVFCVFRSVGVEVILPDDIASLEWVQASCADRGVTIVSVPRNDTDHVPSGWKLPAFLRGAWQYTFPEIR